MKIIDVDNNEAIQYLHEQLDIVIENGNVSLEDISIVLDSLIEANGNDSNKLFDDNIYTKIIRIVVKNIGKWKQYKGREKMIDLNFKIYDEIFIDPKEFFSKIKNIELNLERFIYDNESVLFKERMNGYDFRCLLSGIVEEVEADEEYITIAKVNDGIMIRHKVFNELEGELINEWFLRYRGID